MNDRLRLGLLALLTVFLVSLPFWWPLVRPATTPVVLAPEALAAGSCLADASLMRAEHGLLLKTWRDLVIREDRRYGPWPLATSGGSPPNSEVKIWAYRLDTCWSCHSNRQEFCLRCHDRIGVSPNCFTCHFEPPLPEKAASGTHD